MPYICWLIPFGPTRSTWVGLGELLIGVGEHTVNQWVRGFGLGEHGLALGRSQGQIPPTILLLLIGAEKVGVKLFSSSILGGVGSLQILPSLRGLCEFL